MSLFTISNGVKAKFLSRSLIVSPVFEVVDLPLGLQCFYRLNDTSESSGNGNPFTINNGTVTFSSGKIGNAVVLGSGTMRANIVSPFSRLESTVSFWFNPVTIGGVMFNSPSFNIGLGSNKLYVSNITSNEFYSEFGGLVPNVWRHVVCIISGGKTKLYADGEKIWDFESRISYNSSFNYVQLGGQGDIGLFRFNGLIDAVGVWNRALNDTEVRELYNSGIGLEI